MSGYIGTQPVPQATQHREAFTATEIVHNSFAWTDTEERAAAQDVANDTPDEMKGR